MKFSDLKDIFAQEQTSRGLVVVGLDAEGRKVNVVFGPIATATQLETVAGNSHAIRQYSSHEPYAS